MTPADGSCRAPRVCRAVASRGVPRVGPLGGIAYFQARFLQPPDGRDKYDNPSRKWAPNPRVAWTRTPTTVCAHDGLLVVAEGIPDALIAAQAGLSAVTVLGSMYPDARVADAIASYAQAHAVDVAVCFDCDPSESGAKGASRLVELLDDRSVRSVANVAPADGTDLSDWAAIGDAWVTAFDKIATTEIDSLMELSITDTGGDLGLGF